MLVLFSTPHFITSAQALLAKGLIEHSRPPEGKKMSEEYGWKMTARGRAIADMMVEQARHIAALDDSRLEREARVSSTKKRRPVGAL